MRILALSLPHLPIEVVLRSSPDLVRSGRPVALVEAKGGSLHVVAASREALEAGVTVGGTHAHALAVAPELLVRERRPEEERTALRAIARWASLVLSPRAAVDDERRAVLVDVKGIEHVHGTEAALLARALGELSAFGYDVRGAIADTKLAALALAETVGGVAAEGATLEALLPLPLGALALDDVALERLAAVGVETVEQLVALPRRALPARVGEAVLERLDRALGERQDPLVAEKLPETVHERILLDGGTSSLEALALVLEALVARTMSVLAACSLAARAVELGFTHEDAAPTRFEVRLAAPIATPRALLSVLRERLDRVDLERPVLAVDLRVVETARVVAKQGDLFSGRDGSQVEDLACLVARLEGRLGARQVARVELVADHRPELAFGWRAASEPVAADPSALAPGRRPTRLLARPQPLDVAVSEDGAPLGFHAAVGPERIETGFWDGEEVRRDYWIVADSGWRERWIFREISSGRWFLHGIFE